MTSPPADAAAAAAALDVSAEELRAAWAIATGTGMVAVSGHRAGPGKRFGVLESGRPDEALATWCEAAAAVLSQENLDGLATALYTAGRPVRLDALFEAYAAAVGALTVSAPDGPGGAEDGKIIPNGPDAGRAAGTGSAAGTATAAGTTEAEIAPAFSPAFSPGWSRAWSCSPTSASSSWAPTRTKTTRPGSPSPCRRSGCGRSGNGSVPAAGVCRSLGGSADGGAAAVLAVLADYDADDGEAEIAAWLGRRAPERAAEELTEAASQGSPGLRGAAFAVMDRVGAAAVPAVRRALANPVLRPHAAVWLREHGEEAGLSREDSAWLLVDLGAGLLEEAAPEDVVAELLPDLPPQAQAELVAGLWRVEHPGVTELLTTLSNHHPEPDVAKAARKAAFKARSRL